MVTILLVPFRVLFTDTKDADFLVVICYAKRKVNKHRRWHTILRAKSGILYILQQKLMICCPSHNQCQFVPDSTVCRVSQTTSEQSRRITVKCTLVQALRLCTGRTTHSGNRGIALLLLDNGTRRGQGSASRPGCSLPPGKTRYPLSRRLGGPQVWSGRKNLATTGIRSPDRPARSQSLY